MMVPVPPSSPVEAAELNVEHSEAIIIEQPVKRKGRQRILQSLQRMSSSPSLAQLTRKRASSNPYGGSRGTISCVSFASPSTASYGGSYSSQLSGGPSTAPTSVPGTPASEPLDAMSPRLAVRKAQGAHAAYFANHGPMTCPIPGEVLRPMSRGTPSNLRLHSDIIEIEEDYFSRPIGQTRVETARRAKLDFFGDLPHEIQLAIFRYLTPKELVRTSIVSKQFRRFCYDGQLWTSVDASGYYKDIPAESLTQIIRGAGPFVKDLNLRGCVQVEHYQRADIVVESCKNLVNATLEGCRNFRRQTLHKLLESNSRLAHVNLTGLVAVNNHTCKVVARNCPQLESLNVSWCTHMDARGIKTILRSCPNLKDLRAGEIRGFSNPEIAEAVFLCENLERLVLSGCSDINDETLKIMMTGIDPEMDILEDRAIVPVRKLRHLDLSRCPLITDAGLKNLAFNVPDMEGLQLSGLVELTDSAFQQLLLTTPHLTHLDLEDLSQLTNDFLAENLAKAPCASRLEHLSISYCDALGDVGVLPLIKACSNLRSIDMDNTRISDLVLAEAASMVRARSLANTAGGSPRVTLNMVVFDCQNVTWTGVREVLSRNAEIRMPSRLTQSYPSEVIGLKCFYGYQQTVEEHTKRVLAGQYDAAASLERAWADYMQAQEEAGTSGAHVRRRRRRLREAAMVHDEEGGFGGNGMEGIGRRRRARSGPCLVM